MKVHRRAFPVFVRLRIQCSANLLAIYTANNFKRMLQKLSYSEETKYDPRSLPLTELQFSPCYNTLKFRAFDQCWQFDDRTATIYVLKTLSDFLWIN